MKKLVSIIALIVVFSTIAIVVLQQPNSTKLGEDIVGETQPIDFDDIVFPGVRPPYGPVIP